MRLQDRVIQVSNTRIPGGTHGQCLLPDLTRQPERRQPIQSKQWLTNLPKLVRPGLPETPKIPAWSSKWGSARIQACGERQGRRHFIGTIQWILVSMWTSWIWAKVRSLARNAAEKAVWTGSVLSQWNHVLALQCVFLHPTADGFHSDWRVHVCVDHDLVVPNLSTFRF